MTARFALALLALALPASISERAAAQSFHIEFGHHYHRRHHHHCYDWHPGFYYGYVRPPPVAYIYPPPVHREVTYVYPPQSASLAPHASPPVSRAAASPLPAAQANPVVIHNPAGSGGAVAFVIDENAEINLKPGGSHSLSSGSSYLVEFDRGGGYGVARRTLGQGNFEFVVTERGWDLISESESTARLSAKPNVRPNAIPARPNLR